MIRTTITPSEFTKLTWTAFENVASDINDISVSLINEGKSVEIAVLGMVLQTMSVVEYNEIIK